MLRLRHKIMLKAIGTSDHMVLMLCGTSTILMHLPDSNSLESGGVDEITSIVSLTASIFAVLLGWYLILHLIDFTNPDRYPSNQSQLRDHIFSNIACTAWLIMIAQLTPINNPSAESCIVFFVLLSSAGIAVRYASWILAAGRHPIGSDVRKVIIAGTSNEAATLARMIESQKHLGLQIQGFISDTANSQADGLKDYVASDQIMGSVEESREIFRKYAADELLICLPIETSIKSIRKLTRIAKELGIVARIVPTLENGELLARLKIESLCGIPLITLFREDRIMQLLAKRAIDICISSTALALLSPLMLTIAIAIKLSGSGPVIYSQTRVGMNQRKFCLYKFRTMVENADDLKQSLSHLNEQDGYAFKIQLDPRVTRVGRVLRRLSLDELPQFINVLKGDMSLVGPRPPLPDEVHDYPWRYRARLSVKPGITCIWQVSGRNKVSFERWMEMDREYISNWSLWLDLRIIMKTVPAVLSGYGAS